MPWRGVNRIINKSLRYEWDEVKNAANKAKHGLAFETLTAFDWGGALIVRDGRVEYGESRFKALGAIEDRLCVVIFAERGNGVRIISLRKANARERKYYGETKA